MSAGAGIVAEAMALVKRMSVTELLDFRAAQPMDGLFDHADEQVTIAPLPVVDSPSDE